MTAPYDASVISASIVLKPGGDHSEASESNDKKKREVTPKCRRTTTPDGFSVLSSNSSKSQISSLLMRSASKGGEPRPRLKTNAVPSTSLPSSAEASRSELKSRNSSSLI